MTLPEKRLDRLTIAAIILLILASLAQLHKALAFDQPIRIEDFLLPISFILLALLFYYFAGIKKITIKSAKNPIQKIFIVGLPVLVIAVLLLWFF